jgi:hypothetical protein
MVREVLAAALAAALIFAVAYVGCGSVQEAHDNTPKRVIFERDTVF